MAETEPAVPAEQLQRLQENMGLQWADCQRLLATLTPAERARFLEAMREHPDAVRGPRRWWQRPGRVALVAAFAFLAHLVAWVYLAYIDWFGHPAPLPWVMALETAGRPGLTGNAHVYQFWGRFIDSEYLWRIEASPEIVPLLVEHWRLRELKSADEVPADFWRQPPHWWKPNRDGAGRFFVSPEFNPRDRGPDGMHYLLMYDEAEGVLYAWVKDNF